MGATAEISSAGGGRRLAIAFGLSVVVHALVAVLAPGWRVESRPVSPLVVTMVARGGGEGAGGGAGAPVAAAEPAPAALVAAPPIAPPAPAPVAPRMPTARASRPVRRAPAASAPVPESAPDDAIDPTAVAGGAGAVASGGAGLGDSANNAGGSGAPGAGGRGGAGVGSDGLRAFCASCPAPEYPGRARRQGWQGTVDVALAIARDGSVHEARVDRSSGYPALDDVALDVARRSRFAVPDGGDGLRGQLRYRFVLDATAARR